MLGPGVVRLLWFFLYRTLMPNAIALVSGNSLILSKGSLYALHVRLKYMELPQAVLHILG